MDTYTDGVMIALVPMTSDWCSIEVPHMTLVYAGKTGDLTPNDLNNLTKDAASLAMISSSIYARVSGVEQMGKGEPEDPQVDVLKLQPTPELWAMRRAVEDWNVSDFPFAPHCTIGPVGSAGKLDYIPPALAFDRIMVGWGEEYCTFWLKR